MKSIRVLAAMAFCGLALQIAVAADPPVAEMTVRPDGNEVLVIRGQVAMLTLDIVAARRLFAGPAEDGSITAARGMAQSFDPVWLAKRGVTPLESFADADQAVLWYKRAAEYGDVSEDNRYVQATK